MTTQFNFRFCHLLLWLSLPGMVHLTEGLICRVCSDCIKDPGLTMDCSEFLITDKLARGEKLVCYKRTFASSGLIQRGCHIENFGKSSSDSSLSFVNSLGFPFLLSVSPNHPPIVIANATPAGETKTNTTLGGLGCHPAYLSSRNWECYCDTDYCNHGSKPDLPLTLLCGSLVMAFLLSQR